MKKTTFAWLVLVLASTALVGCRVEAEVDPDGEVSYTGALPS